METAQRQFKDMERLELQNCSLGTGMNVECLDGGKRGQQTVHKALLPGDTDKEVGIKAEIYTASRATAGLAHLEEVRGKLQHR